VAVTDRGFTDVDIQTRTNVPHIFAIGDIIGQPMLAHKAVHEAHLAEHFETWLDLSSAGQLGGQGCHHTPAPYIKKAFGFAETSFLQIPRTRNLCPRLCPRPL